MKKIVEAYLWIALLPLTFVLCVLAGAVLGALWLGAVGGVEVWRAAQRRFEGK